MHHLRVCLRTSRQTACVSRKRGYTLALQYSRPRLEFRNVCKWAKCRRASSLETLFGKSWKVICSFGLLAAVWEDEGHGDHQSTVLVLLGNGNFKDISPPLSQSLKGFCHSPSHEPWHRPMTFIIYVGLSKHHDVVVYPKGSGLLFYGRQSIGMKGRSQWKVSIPKDLNVVRFFPYCSSCNHTEQQLESLEALKESSKIDIFAGILYHFSCSKASGAIGCSNSKLSGAVDPRYGSEPGQGRGALAQAMVGGSEDTSSTAKEGKGQDSLSFALASGRLKKGDCLREGGASRRPRPSKRGHEPSGRAFCRHVRIASQSGWGDRESPPRTLHWFTGTFAFHKKNSAMVQTLDEEQRQPSG